MNTLLRIPNRYPWISLAILGLILVLTGSLVSFPAPGPGAVNHELSVAEIGSGTEVGQSFRADEPVISGMRLWLKPPFPSTGRLSFRINLAGRNELPLVELNLPLEQVSPDGVVDLRFAPTQLPQVSLSETGTIKLQLRVDGLPEGKTLILLGNTGSYPNGKALLDGQPDTEYDLAFAPVYQRRAFDYIWPISRIASGRPGLLAWPPLYPLITYGYALLLIYVLTGVWRTIRNG